MIYAHEDPFIDWERYEEDRERQDDKALHCDECGERIWEDYYEIDGVIYCPDCIEEKRRTIG